MDSCLVLFGKVPIPGRCKTRLCPPLTHEEAAGLYAGFLREVVVASQRIPDVALRLAVYPWERRAELPDPDLAVDMMPQEGAERGERLENAFVSCFAEGFTRVVIRNTDSPCLPEARVCAAFERLMDPAIDLVLGPDYGGGYYLIGAKRALPCQLIEALEGSPHEVFQRTLGAARRAGLVTAVLRSEHDIDVPADLDLLEQPR